MLEDLLTIHEILHGTIFYQLVFIRTHPKNILEICGMNENNQKFHTRKN